MKRFAIVMLCLMALMIGWWLSRPSVAPEITQPNTHAATAARKLPFAPSNPAAESESKIIQLHARTPFLGMADPRWADYHRKQAEDMSWQWKTPIEFFGKVVDENGQGVALATIEVSWSGLSSVYGGDGVGQRTLTSDANGMFTLTGVQGKGIGVRVSKEGYHRRKDSNHSSFEYAGFWEPTFIEPDSSNPVLFPLVKKREAELTYHLDGRVIIKPPGLEAHLDLLSKPVQRDVPSDLFVRITRPPTASHEAPFDWKVEIEGRNGSELVESEEEFMTLAPADGYKPQLLREHKALTSGAWQKTRFYVRNKPRNFFAAVEIEAAAYYPFDGQPGAALFITATVNPNNSPNLEYDPAKDIREMAKK